MSEQFLNWLSTRGQVDFGNLFVGIGTVLVAIVSLVVSLTNISASRREFTERHELEASRKIADFRRVWLEDLRVHFAEFSRCYSLLVFKNKKIYETTGFMQHSIEDLRDGDNNEYLSDLMYNLHYINLMLNGEEENHKNLSKMMLELLKTKTEVKLSDFNKLARKILKQEWDRLKSETRQAA